MATIKVPKPEWVLGDDRGKGKSELYSRPLHKLVNGRYVVVGYLNDRDAAHELMEQLESATEHVTKKAPELRLTQKGDAE